MSAQTKQRCPRCEEEMDMTDRELKPCKCGYEICLWCWHRLMGMDQNDESGGRCPGCHSLYNKDRIMGTSVSNQILKGLCADKSNWQKEHTKSHKQKLAKVQLGLAEEPKDPNNVHVIQRKLVYIVGMPSEFASEKVLRQKTFLGQYGKIENIIIDNVGANQQIPDSGRVYVTFSRVEEAVRCIQAVNGYILDGRPLKATFGVTRYCHIWLDNRVCQKPNCSYMHHKAAAEDICSKDDVSVVCARLQHLMGMDTKGFQHHSGSTLPPPGDCNSRTTACSGISKDVCTNGDRLLPNGGNKNPALLPATNLRDSNLPSGCPSIANVVLHQQSDHESIHSNQQNDKSWASAQLGNDSSNSKQITSAENGSSDTSRQMASTDTRSKATGQVGNGTSSSTKLNLVKERHSETAGGMSTKPSDGKALMKPGSQLGTEIGSDGSKHSIGILEADVDDGCDETDDEKNTEPLDGKDLMKATNVENDSDLEYKTRLQEAESANRKLARQLRSAEKRLRKVKSENHKLKKELDATQEQRRELKSENRKLVRELNTVEELHVEEPEIRSKKLRRKLAKCHDVFICSKEVNAKELLHHLTDRRSEILCIVDIPGVTDPLYNFDKLNKMSPLAKVVFLGMIDDVYQLHRAGLSLGGEFSIKDFYWTVNRKVKLGPNVRKHIIKRNRKLKNLDFQRLSKLIEEIWALSNVPIPRDLEILLEIMRSDDPSQYELLIRYNICLMDELAKRAYTLILHTRMKQLDKEDFEKFGTKFWKYRTETAMKHINVIEGWSANMCTNKFVKKVYDKMGNDMGRGCRRTKDFVDFLRHCMVHLIDHAFDEEKKTHYTDANVVDMVEVHSPGAFSEFQKGMNAIDQVALPYLMRTMKT